MIKHAFKKQNWFSGYCLKIASSLDFTMIEKILVSVNKKNLLKNTFRVFPLFSTNRFGE
jgi:hypothetical protein